MTDAIGAGIGGIPDLGGNESFRLGISKTAAAFENILQTQESDGSYIRGSEAFQIGQYLNKQLDDAGVDFFGANAADLTPEGLQFVTNVNVVHYQNQARGSSGSSTTQGLETARFLQTAFAPATQPQVDSGGVGASPVLPSDSQPDQPTSIGGSSSPATIDEITGYLEAAGSGSVPSRLTNVSLALDGLRGLATGGSDGAKVDTMDSKIGLAVDAFQKRATGDSDGEKVDVVEPKAVEAKTVEPKAVEVKAAEPKIGGGIESSSYLNESVAEGADLVDLIDALDVVNVALARVGTSSLAIGNTPENAAVREQTNVAIDLLIDATKEITAAFNPSGDGAESITRGELADILDDVSAIVDSSIGLLPQGEGSFEVIDALIASAQTFIPIVQQGASDAEQTV